MINSDFIRAWKANAPMVNLTVLIKEWNEFFPLIDAAINKDLEQLSAYHWLQLKSSTFVPLGDNTKEVIKKYSLHPSSTALFLLMRKELNLQGYKLNGSNLLNWDQKLYL